MCADTPGCDGRALVLQGIDQVLIQVVGGGDDGIRETGLIEHLAGFLGEVGKVAAVEADAVAFAEFAFVAQILECLDRVRDTGFEGVIGVSEQDAGVGIQIAVGLEGGQLIREAHDPAVGVRALYGDVKELSA